MTPERVLISNITTPQGENALRIHTPDDKKEWAKTMALKNDISNRGMLDSFSVRPIGEGKYEVINGSRRFTCAKMLHEEGHPDFADGYITVSIVEADEYESLASQLATNFHMNKTLKGKEIKAVQRLSLAKGWDLNTTAEKVGMSSDYLKKLMKTTYLPDNVQALIDSGEMSLAAAIQLSKLPSDLIDDHVEEALVLSVADFTAKIAQALDEYKKSVQKGNGGEVEFSLTHEFAGKEAVELALDSAEAEYQLDASDYNRGRLDVLQELFAIDEKSAHVRKAEWDKKQEEKETKKVEREAARQAKKIEDAKKLIAENEAK